MIEISSGAHYDQPASTVLAILADPSSYPAWQADVESASLEGDTSAQRGARIRQVRKVMGGRAEITLTISELVTGERLTIATDPDTKPAIRQSWQLQSDDSGCCLGLQLNLDGVPGMAERLIRAQLSRTVPQMLDCLGAVPASCSGLSSRESTKQKGRPMRVFVTGATGALGRHLVPGLVAAGHEVTATTRTPGKDAQLRAAAAARLARAAARRGVRRGPDDHLARVPQPEGAQGTRLGATVCELGKGFRAWARR